VIEPRRRTLGWGLVALGLVAVVAMEANGAAWSKHRGAGVHSLPHGVVVAGVVCAGLFGISLVVFLLVGTRVSETPEQRRKRWTTAITFLVIIALISIVRVLFHPSHPPTKRDVGATTSGQRTAVSGNGGSRTSDTWWPIVIVGLGTAAAFMTAVVRRPGADAAPDEDTDAATIAVLDASLDDLRSEPDPRRAVIAAYARMERGMAARGFARQPWETPTEYLRRALSGGTSAAAFPAGGLEPLRELTALAERARFSTLAVDESMRSRAITALESLRASLRRQHDADLGRIG
jgi:hypothetical protein